MHYHTVYIEDSQLVKFLKEQNQELRSEVERLKREHKQLQLKLIDEMQLSFRLTDELREAHGIIRDYRNGTGDK